MMVEGHAMDQPSMSKMEWSVYSIENVPERNELRHEAEGTWNIEEEREKKRKRKRRIEEEDRRKL